MDRLICSLPALALQWFTLQYKVLLQLLYAHRMERPQRVKVLESAGWIILLYGLILLMCPSIAHARTIIFAGQEWTIRSGTGGPGANHWSDSTESVWVDKEGLHLKIRKIDNVWHCAEVTSVLPTRYGMHRFYVASRIDLLDKNVVASPFLYKDDSHEVDIEFSRWQKASGNNAQYVVQPYNASGNIHRFETKLKRARSTHYFDWEPGSIHFNSFRGHTAEPRRKRFLLQEWTYTGGDNPPQDDELRIHINLWLVNGKPPSDGKEVEFVLKSADLPGPTLGSPGAADGKTENRR
jgi:hypothetical protein